MLKLSVSKAWDETSRFLTKETRLIAPVALAAFLVPTALFDWAFPGDTAGGGAALLLMLIVLGVAFVGQMAIAALATGWRGSVGEAIGQAFRRLPGLLGALAIFFVPIGLVAGIVLALAMASAGMVDPAKVTPEAIAKSPGVTATLLVLFIILLSAAARLFPITAIAINERPRPLALVKRCWNLTRGNFGRLIVVTLLLLLAAAVLGRAVKSVVGSGAGLAFGPAQPLSLSALLIGIAGGLAGALISAVSATFAGRIYAQLVGGATKAVTNS